MSNKETRIDTIPLLEDVLEYKILDGIIDVREAASCNKCGGNCNKCSQSTRKQTCKTCKRAV